MQQEYTQAIIKELHKCNDLELLDLILKLLQNN
jgi:hypothetical protein